MAGVAMLDIGQPPEALEKGYCSWYTPNRTQYYPPRHSQARDDDMLLTLSSSCILDKSGDTSVSKPFPSLIDSRIQICRNRNLKPDESAHD
jgi:hypothetical protein